MYIKKYRSTSPGLRHARKLKISGAFLFNKLCTNLNKKGGRNNTGSITVQHRGGRGRFQHILLAHKSLIYVPGQILKISYPKNSSACAALIKYRNGLLSYNLLPGGAAVGDYVNVKVAGHYSPGSLVPLKFFKIGQNLHSIILKAGWPAQYIKAGGAGGLIKSRKANLVKIKLPSGKFKDFNINSWAYFGRVGTNIWKFTQLGSAGRARRRGCRPQVRGLAMNAVDHPHGGQSGPSRSSVSPWGWPTK